MNATEMRAQMGDEIDMMCAYGLLRKWARPGHDTEPPYLLFYDTVAEASYDTERSRAEIYFWAFKDCQKMMACPRTALADNMSDIEFWWQVSFGNVPPPWLARPGTLPKWVTDGWEDFKKKNPEAADGFEPNYAESDYYPSRVDDPPDTALAEAPHRWRILLDSMDEKLAEIELAINAAEALKAAIREWQRCKLEDKFLFAFERAENLLDHCDQVLDDFAKAGSCTEFEAHRRRRLMLLRLRLKNDEEPQPKRIKLDNLTELRDWCNKAQEDAWRKRGVPDPEDARRQFGSPPSPLDEVESTPERTQTENGAEEATQTVAPRSDWIRVPLDKEDYFQPDYDWEAM